MKKRRIVIASVLKPVDDTRMLDKMGETLASSGDSEIFIIGYPSRIAPTHPSIQFLPLKTFPRLSLARVFASLKVLLKVIQVRPEILIVNTHELLIVAVLNRIFFGAKIFYDIRENYYRNIRFGHTFPSALTLPLALWVRLKEKLTAPFFNGLFLAERGYEKEMKFFGGRAVVLENKVVPLRPPFGMARLRRASSGTLGTGEVIDKSFESHSDSKAVPKVPEEMRQRRIIPKGGRQGTTHHEQTTLLFTGTLATTTGVFQAIRLAKLLHTENPTIRLHIIGYCAQSGKLQKIRSAIAGHEFITLTGGATLVPHDEIIQAIQTADFGLIHYPPSPHTENSIPTKLYEYLAYQLPILLQNHSTWTALAAPSQAAIPVDFGEPDLKGILQAMATQEFYVTEPEGVWWDGEAFLKALG